MNELTKYNIWDLVGKHLAGETTPLEDQQLSEWRSISAENEQEFVMATKVWEDSGSINNDSIDFDTDNAWNTLSDKIEDSKHVIIPNSRFIIPKWLRYAASIIFIIGVSFLLLSRKMHNEVITIASANEIKLITLPDNSTVTLHQNSSISYSGYFNDTKRDIELNGIACFDVSPNKEKPFVVNTKYIRVSVLGTSFYINTGKNNSPLVSVSKGRVKFQSNEISDFVILEKGNAASLDTIGLQINLQKLDSNLLGFKTGVYVFKNSKLNYVARILSQGYNKNIIIDKSLNDLLITFTAKNKSLDEILLVIGKTLSVKVSKQDQNITISRLAQ